MPRGVWARGAAGVSGADALRPSAMAERSDPAPVVVASCALCWGSLRAQQAADGHGASSFQCGHGGAAAAASPAAVVGWPATAGTTDAGQQPPSVPTSTAAREADAVGPPPTGNQAPRRVAREWLAVRPPPERFVHAAYLVCRFWPSCRHGPACIRAHGPRPEAELWYWQRCQPPLVQGRRKGHGKAKRARAPPGAQPPGGRSHREQLLAALLREASRPRSPSARRTRYRAPVKGLVKALREDAELSALLLTHGFELEGATFPPELDFAALVGALTAMPKPERSGRPHPGPHDAHLSSPGSCSLHVVQERIKLLIAASSGPIHGGKLFSLYKQRFKEPLKLKQVGTGYRRLKDLALAMPDTIEVSTAAGGHLLLSLRSGALDQSPSPLSPSATEPNDWMLQSSLSWMEAMFGPSSSAQRQREASDLAVVRAVRNQNLGELLDLLDAGGDPNVRDPLTDQSALRLAVETGSHAIVDTLLCRGAETDEVAGDGRSLLHQAVAKGQLHVLERLLAAGLNVNARDTEGRTPLHVAAIASQPLTVRLLVDAGAVVDAEDSAGNSPLICAVRLVESSSTSKAITINALLETGADVSKAGENGMAACHWAACLGLPDTLLVLLGSVSDINMPCDTGNTPLHLAAANSKAVAARVLLENGADPLRRNGLGQTVEDVAGHTVGPLVAKYAQRCAACGARRGEPGVRLSTCSGCGSVKYCSRQCQVSHWEQHSPACNPGGHGA